MNAAITLSDPFRDVRGANVPSSGVGEKGSAVPIGPAPARPSAPLQPAATFTLTSSTAGRSERLLIYGSGGALAGGTGAVQGDPSAPAETNPADILDRKVAESRKELAALQIKQLKLASRDAEVLALINPKGAISFAKNAATTLSGAAQTLRDSERTISGIEDKQVADAQPEEITAIAHDVYSQTITLDLDIASLTDGSQEVEAAIRRRSETEPKSTVTEPGTRSDPRSHIRLVQTTQLEATTIVTLRDGSTAEPIAAKVAADRSERLGQDADVIKDAISTLRSLNRIIVTSTKKLQETGGLDQRMADEIADARSAFFDAVAATAAAALPIVQAGYSVIPDDEG